jgi:Fatty acid desaturase
MQERDPSLPNVLRWLTANIGVHHVHHLSSRIPYYRLPRVLRDHPELAPVGRLTLLESLRCVRMVLWDERRRRSFPFARYISSRRCLTEGRPPNQLRRSHLQLGGDGTKEDYNGVDNCFDRRDNHAARDDSLVGVPRQTNDIPFGRAADL